MFIAYRGHADYVDVPAPLNLAAVPNGWPVKVPPETREALVHPGGAWVDVDPDDVDALRRERVEAVNAWRAAAGLTPLTVEEV